MSAPARGRLAGRRILVTRPAGQGERLAELIRAAGGEPIVFPVLEIREPADPAALDAAVERLDEFTLAVFVSLNAVERAMRAIEARRRWPARLRAAAIGESTALALRRHGVTDVIVPHGRSDSEALLEHPALQAVAGWRVVVFRGDGGRELLGDTLAARGARVEYVACYRRIRPELDPAPVIGRWQRGEIDAVTVTSSEGLRNLFEMLGPDGRALLRRTPLFAPHVRIAQSARALGCERVVETAPADAGLCAGLVAFWDNSAPPAGSR